MPRKKQSSQEAQPQEIRDRVALYWDCQNVKISPDRADFLMNFAKSKGQVVVQNAYSNWRYESNNNAKYLEQVGFIRVNVPSSARNSVDHKLNEDAIDKVFEKESPNFFILVSGDGDFASLVHILKSKGKQTIVFVQKSGFSQQLIDLADESHIIESLDEIPQLPPFRERDLLNRALTHRSYVNENPKIAEHNERLEFLGDSVLNFISSKFLYDLYPDISEAQLTRMRSALVDKTQLADFANYLNVGKHMKLGKGAIKDKSRKNESLLSDTFEAIVGAYFLDSGIEAVRNFMKPLFDSAAEGLLDRAPDVHSTILVDAKNRFQEWVQASIGPVQPKYVTIERSGLDHAPEFTVEVQVEGKVYGIGKGRSKKEAEKRAAEEALKDLGEL